MKYVTVEYEAQLNDLADLICTPERFSSVLNVVELAMQEMFPELV